MLGKYDSTRDSVLHFLCTQEWSNDSTGDDDYGKSVWRISNTRDEIFGCFNQGNTELDSVLEILVESEQIELTDELRNSLVGHFLVTQLASGLVLVYECETELQLISIFNVIEDEYSEFMGEDEDA